MWTRLKKTLEPERHVIVSGILECQGKRLLNWVRLSSLIWLDASDASKGGPHPMLEDMRQPSVIPWPIFDRRLSSSSFGHETSWMCNK